MAGRGAYKTTLALAVGLAAAAGPARPGRAAAGAQELVVFEAASLKDAFARLAATFEKAHPGVKVVFNAAGSHELRAQIEHGAAADVFASADRKHMDALRATGAVRAPTVFACNEPVIVVAPSAAATVRSFADLPRAERLVIGTPEVPIGAYTIEILRKAAAKQGAAFAKKVEERVVSRELNVRQVLAKVLLGEADAGIVYRTDAAAARGKVQVVAIPPAFNVVAEYPIGVLAAAPHPDLGRAFVDLVTSPAGAAVLRDFGFMSCPSP
jgi:molybdate transport system substrate-binding protein